jgi:hypothetical protein
MNNEKFKIGIFGISNVTRKSNIVSMRLKAVYCSKHFGFIINLLRNNVSLITINKFSSF